MNQEILEESLRIDREDLLALLNMRFGTVRQEIKTQVETTEDGNLLQRLILVVANAPDWESVVREFKNGGDGAFRIVGEDFNPIPSSMKGIG